MVVTIYRNPTCYYIGTLAPLVIEFQASPLNLLQLLLKARVRDGQLHEQACVLWVSLSCMCEGLSICRAKLSYERPNPISPRYKP